MTQEDKKLLLQDLCARLPYNVYIDDCGTPHRLIFQLSAIAERLGKQKAIEPGEPADLVLKSLLPAYRKLGRDRIIALIKEGKTEKEIKAIAKSIKKSL